MHELDSEEQDRSLVLYRFTLLERERDRQHFRRTRRWRAIRRRAPFALTGGLLLVAVWLIATAR